MDRRGFPRVSITESIKIGVLDRAADSPVAYGTTIDVSRGGLEAVVQGAAIPLRSRCVVRFLATTRIEPVMVWGVVTGVEERVGQRVVRVEFESPLEKLTLAPKQHRSEVVSARVLVVDDEAHIRDVVGRYLSGMGYEVSFAEDGQQGLPFLPTISDTDPE